MTGDVERYLAVGAVLFVLGALGFFTRRNLILMVLSAELMLHGVSLTLVTFGRLHNNFEGQAFTIFILTVAACEAGLALSLILALYQKSKSLDIDFWTDLREPGLPSPRLEEMAEERSFAKPQPIEYPALSPAGRVPEPDLRKRREEVPLVSDARSQTADTPLEPPPAEDMKHFVGKE
jgi:NADH-quinone oxidoreductase subunit K